MQVMDKAQLPVLMSIMMITQAVLSTPCGLRAKRSLKARNNLLLGGFGTMIVADLFFAKMATPTGTTGGVPLGLEWGWATLQPTCRRFSCQSKHRPRADNDICAA